MSDICSTGISTESICFSNDSSIPTILSQINYHYENDSTLYGEDFYFLMNLLENRVYLIFFDTSIAYNITFYWDSDFSFILEKTTYNISNIFGVFGTYLLFTPSTSGIYGMKIEFDVSGAHQYDRDVGVIEAINYEIDHTIRTMANYEGFIIVNVPKFNQYQFSPQAYNLIGYKVTTGNGEIRTILDDTAQSIDVYQYLEKGTYVFISKVPIYDFMIKSLFSYTPILFFYLGFLAFGIVLLISYFSIIIYLNKRKKRDESSHLIGKD